MLEKASTVRIFTEDGQEQMNEERAGAARISLMGIPLLLTDEIGKGGKPFTYALRVPRGLYSRIADQPVRLEIDHYLTLLKLAGYADASGDWRGSTDPRAGLVRAPKSVERAGKSWSDASGLDPCRAAGQQCWNTMPTGTHNPPIVICSRPDYSPLWIPLRAGRAQPLHGDFTVRKSGGCGYLPGEVKSDASGVAGEAEDVCGRGSFRAPAHDSSDPAQRVGRR